MTPSSTTLKRITDMIVETAECVARADHFKYYDICSTFNFLWSIYKTDREMEERNGVGSWGPMPLPEQEPTSSWFFDRDIF